MAKFVVGFAVVVTAVFGGVVGGTVLLADGAVPGFPSANDTAGAATSTPQAANPWGQRTVVVAVRNRAAPSRNFTAAVAAALEYWAGHGRYGDYAVDFRLEPDATDPDIRVWYNESIDCRTHSDAIGCAPLLNDSHTVASPQNVRIRYDPSANFRQVRNTVVHEFGHVLGITHCEAPHWVMSSGCTKAGAVRAPDVEAQPFAWRERNLTIHVNYAGVSARNRSETEAQVDHALAYFENGSGEYVPESLAFSRVERRWKADVVVRIGSCDGGHPACGRWAGRDHDADGNFEYYTGARITVERVDVAARGWYVGYELARTLTPDGIPPVFEDPTYERIRSDWWTRSD